MRVSAPLKLALVCVGLLWLASIPARSQQGSLGTVSALVDAPSAVRDQQTASTFAASSASAAPLSAAPPSATLAAAPPIMPPTHNELHLDAEIARNTACESGELRGKSCQVSWPRVLASSFFFLSAQTGGNVGMDDDARYHLLHHTDGFWGDYVTTLERYRWSRWNDDDPFGVDYVGHPLMGAITNFVYIQNDPKQRALDFENTRRYWMGRLRATAYSAAYSAQWKIGPISESADGNIGIKTYYSDKLGRYTNETGMVDFFVTPAGGILWNIGEDVIDKKLFRRVTHNVRNRWLLDAASMMTPAKCAANILRFRAPYYRDRDADSPIPLRP